MSGLKTNGWVDFDHASGNLMDTVMDYMNGKASDQDMLLQMATNLAKVADGLQDSLQEAYERMERLHQKIDRMEKKIGSVPAAK
jgi:hypothetical protein